MPYLMNSLIDYQSARLFWVNVSRFIPDQGNLMLDADTSPLIHSLAAEWRSMVKEIVDAKQQTTIVHGNLARFLPIWRMLVAL
jgi:hypothetical protein